MDYLQPESLDKNHKFFILERLAKGVDPLVIKDQFQKFFELKIEGSAILEIQRNNKEEIKAARSEIYNNGIEDLPLAHAYTIIAISQMRVEDLLKNPKIMRTVRRIDEAGREYWDEIKEIDDSQIDRYLRIAQTERHFNIKAEIQKVVSQVDKRRIPTTSFKPIIVDTGFELSEQKEE